MDKMIKKKQVTAIILFFVTAIYLFAIEDDVKRIKSILNRESAEIEKVVKKEGKKEIYYFLINKNSPDMKYLIFSDYIFTTKEGMNGKVPIIVVTDKNFNITEILIEKNLETQIQVERIRKNRYVSKVKEQVNSGAENIDVVSGATYTSRAIFEGARDSINKLKKIK